MPETAGAADNIHRVSAADALFVLSQFSGLYQGAHFTLIVQPTRGRQTLFRHHMAVDNFMEDWNDWVLPALTKYSLRGSHILYGVNPSLNPRRGITPCLSTLVASFSLKHSTLAQRLKQMAVLHKARFEPSYVLQWKGGLCGVYVLDRALTPERHAKLSRHIAHLTDSAEAKHTDQPTLLLPLPGFYYDGEIVKLLHPQKPVAVAARLYTAGEFEAFPEVTMENTERFYREANDLGDERAMEFVSNLLREAKEKGDKRTILVGVATIKRQSKERAFKDLSMGFVEPTRTVLADLHALPLKNWNDFSSYVKYGPNMNGDALARLVKQILHAAVDVTIDRPLALQGLDRYILREMAYAGYTQGAAIEFFQRPGNNIGLGKDSVYIAQLYDLEIKLLRAATKEAREALDRTTLTANRNSFEFVTMICNAIDRLGNPKKIPKGTAVFSQDVLGLNPKGAFDKLYVPEMLRERKVPLSLKQLKFIFSRCKDHYWLGKLDHFERYQWRFSIQRLQQHGLLKVFTPLTKSDSALEAQAPKEDVNLEKQIETIASSGSASSAVECDHGSVPNTQAGP